MPENSGVKYYFHILDLQGAPAGALFFAKTFCK